MTMEKVIKDRRIGHKGIQFENIKFGVLAYADDLGLVEEDKIKLINEENNCEESGAKKKLREDKMHDYT